MVITRQVIQADDHKIIFERIVPPVATPETAKITKTTTTRQQIRKSLSLAITVFNHEFSEVRWRDTTGGEYVVWSSIDFTPFTGRSASGFVQGGTCYGLFLGFGEASAGAAAGPLAEFRGAKKPEGTASWYVIRSAPELVPADAYTGINALHVYYDANKTTIVAEHEQVKAANAARLAYEVAHPPVKQDTLIRFWPIQSVLHGVSAPAALNTTED